MDCFATVLGAHRGRGSVTLDSGRAAGLLSEIADGKFDAALAALEAPALPAARSQVRAALIDALAHGAQAAVAEDADRAMQFLETVEFRTVESDHVLQTHRGVLHLWPEGRQHGSLALTHYAAGARVSTACGQTIGPDRYQRSQRGEWAQSANMTRCRRCRRAAGDLPECAEERLYPLLGSDAEAELVAHYHAVQTGAFLDAAVRDGTLLNSASARELADRAYDAALLFHVVDWSTAHPGAACRRLLRRAARYTDLVSALGGTPERRACELTREQWTGIYAAALPGPDGELPRPAEQLRAGLAQMLTDQLLKESR